jgi:hypothetical protein
MGGGIIPHTNPEAILYGGKGEKGIMIIYKQSKDATIIMLMRAWLNKP